LERDAQRPPPTVKPADATDCKITPARENGKRGGGSLEHELGRVVILIVCNPLDILNLRPPETSTSKVVNVLLAGHIKHEKLTRAVASCGPSALNVIRNRVKKLQSALLAFAPNS